MNGTILGFAFRSIDGDASKYIYSKGLIKSEILSNMNRSHSQTEVILVEGVLDSLLCSALNLENVVSLGGSSLSPSQVEILKGCGSKKSLFV